MIPMADCIDSLVVFLCPQAAGAASGRLPRAIGRGGHLAARPPAAGAGRSVVLLVCHGPAGARA